MSSDLKVTNIKHASSGSNNLVLASNGTTTVSGALTASGGIANAGTISAGTIGSAVAFHANHQAVFSLFDSGGNQSMASASTYYKVNLNQADVDSVSGFNSGESRYDFKVAGYYLLMAQITLGATMGTSTAYDLAIYFDDADGTSGDRTRVTSAPNFSGADNIPIQTHCIVNASSGDSAYMRVRKSDSSNTVVMHGTDRNSVFSGFRLLS